MRAVDIRKEWEEDIRGNLRRRRERIDELREKVQVLNDEIAKEEEYAAYLEKLLEIGPQAVENPSESEKPPEELEDKKNGVNYVTVINVKDEIGEEQSSKKLPPKPPPKRASFKQIPKPFGCVVFDSRKKPSDDEESAHNELLDLYREPLDVVRESLSAKSSSSSVSAKNAEDPLYDTVAAEESLEEDYVDVELHADTLRSNASSSDYNLGTMNSGSTGASDVANDDVIGTDSPVQSIGAGSWDRKWIAKTSEISSVSSSCSSPAKLLHRQRRMAYSREDLLSPPSAPQSGDSDDDNLPAPSAPPIESSSPGLISAISRKSSSIDSRGSSTHSSNEGSGSGYSGSGKVNSAPRNLHQQRPLPPVPKARSFSASVGNVADVGDNPVDYPSLDLGSGLFSNSTDLLPSTPDTPPSSLPPFIPRPSDDPPPLPPYPLTRNNSNKQPPQLPPLPNRAAPPPPVPLARRPGPPSLGFKSKADEEAANARQRIVRNIVDTESIYVECLTLVIQYMKALQATLSTSQPVLGAEDFKVIFYKIPDLLLVHQTFLNKLREPLSNWTHLTCIGEPFKEVADSMKVYEAFIQNFPLALEVISKCSKENVQFRDLTSAIKVKSLEGQSLSLQQMLHKPVSRIQNQAMVLNELLNSTPVMHPDRLILSAALKRTQGFLSEIVVVQSADPSLNHSRDRNAERVLVKNAFIVEVVDENQTRKLRHLFLFSDAIVCAKYKPGPPKTPEKFSFDIKWWIPISDVVTDDMDGLGSGFIGGLGGSISAASSSSLLGVSPSASSRATVFLEEEPSNLIALKSQASSVRGQILQHQGSREELSASAKVKNSKGLDKQRKKLAEVESQLVLASPNLFFRIGRQQGRPHILAVSSDYDRTQWLDAIKKIRDSSMEGSKLTPTGVTIEEVSAWMNASRHNLRDALANTLSLFSPLTLAIEGFNVVTQHVEEPPVIGDVNVTILGLQGLPGAAEVYVCLELDAYGHFFRKATTDTLSVRSGVDPFWNQEFAIELEGSRAMRILLYCLEEAPANSSGTSPRPKHKVIGKHIMELNRSSLNEKVNTQERVIPLSADLKLGMKLKFVSSEMTLRRAPCGKPCGLFGVKLAQVCKREKRTIPFIVTCCLREVERRGCKETGIYRVSGSASDVLKLRKSFESNQYEAEQVVKTVDIHSVTGLLKQYLRELPEALIPDAKYPEFFQAYSRIGRVGGSGSKAMDDRPDDPKSGAGTILQLVKDLPQPNADSLKFLLDHLTKINEHELDNKMSVNNLATVFGPTVLKPAPSFNHGHDSNSAHPFLNGTIDVMAQAGIFFLLLDLRRRGYISPCIR